MECPNCQSPDDHHVIRSPRNLVAATVNALSALFWLGFWPFVSIERITSPASPLKRKCLNCGHKFLGELPETPDFDECARCGYNLMGNISGRCPECGWKLPLQYRAYRRKADRLLRKRANRPPE